MENLGLSYGSRTSRRQSPSIALISIGPGGQRIFIRGASDGSDPNFGHSKSVDDGLPGR